MLKTLIAVAAALTLTACGTRKPFEWQATKSEHEAEYGKYLAKGSASITGQAFLQQRNGQTVKAAGRQVTLDPLTSLGNEWREQFGQYYMAPVHASDYAPPSDGFAKSRRTTTADADGKFKFSNLPAGSYYLRTTVTWDVVSAGFLGASLSQQGGIVSRVVEVKDGDAVDLILSTQ